MIMSVFTNILSLDLPIASIAPLVCQQHIMLIIQTWVLQSTTSSNLLVLNHFCFTDESRDNAEARVSFISLSSPHALYYLLSDTQEQWRETNTKLATTSGNRQSVRDKIVYSGFTQVTPPGLHISHTNLVLWSCSDFDCLEIVTSVYCLYHDKSKNRNYCVAMLYSN